MPPTTGSTGRLSTTSQHAIPIASTTFGTQRVAEADPLRRHPLLCVGTTLAVALVAPCQPDGDHAASCQTDKCETVGYSEICTECRAGGVPVGGFCWPPGSPQAAAAGCTEEDGTALDKTAAICEKCGDGYFQIGRASCRERV